MMARLLAAAIALTLFSGCATEETSGFLIVENHTIQAIAVFPHPDGSLINMAAHLPLGGFDENMIAPAGSLGFDSVPGYQPAMGVYLAVYVVHGGGADLTLGMTVRDAQLKRDRGRVSIDALPSPRR